jgi:molybdopterin-guanine dinucleotide biosynthesis protein B
MSAIPTICIVSAVSDTGKTTFMETLISEMVKRGYKVGAVKSDCHGFEMDTPGKDSWRFGQAGAKATVVIGMDKYALVQKTERKKELDEVTRFIEDVDIILVEGFKMENKPKIEVVRQEKGTKIISQAEELIAVVTDVIDLPTSVPIYSLGDYQGVADFIIKKYL